MPGWYLASFLCPELLLYLFVLKNNKPACRPDAGLLLPSVAGVSGCTNLSGAGGWQMLLQGDLCLGLFTFLYWLLILLPINIAVMEFFIFIFFPSAG